MRKKKAHRDPALDKELHTASDYRERELVSSTLPGSLYHLYKANVIWKEEN